MEAPVSQTLPAPRTLEEAFERIQAAGVIDEGEVALLRACFRGAEVIDRASADWLFDLNESMRWKNNHPSWRGFFAQTISAHLLEGAEPKGALTRADADYLIARLASGHPIDPNGLALLVDLIEKAEHCPDRFNAFVLETLQGEIQRDGHIREQDVALIRRVIYGPGGAGGRRVNAMEARFLFSLNEGIRQADAHPSWNTLFAEAFGAFLELVEELDAQVTRIRENTGGFGNQLDEALVRLQSCESLDDARHWMGRLVEDAQSLKGHAEALDQQLARSQSELYLTRKGLEHMTREVFQIRNESLTDPLTGVANRRAFDDHLARESQRARRHKTPLCLALFDLDHFKKVNDLYGHPKGDEVLRVTAQTADKAVRKEDILARFGGEEFILILPNTGLEAGVGVAEKIRAALADLVFSDDRGGEFGVRASFGVCLWDEASESTEALVKRVDAALYRAKSEGRDRVVAG